MIRAVTYHTVHLLFVLAIVGCLVLTGIIFVPCFLLGESIAIYEFLFSGRIFTDSERFKNLHNRGTKLTTNFMQFYPFKVFGRSILDLSDTIMISWRTKFKYSNGFITKHIDVPRHDVAKQFYNSVFCSEENRVYLRIKWGADFE